MSYESITDIGFNFVDGGENPSGIKELAYLIPVSWIETESKPVKTPAPTNASGVVTISGNHVLKAGKQPIKVMPMFEKSGNTFDVEGELLSKIFKSNLELFIPQINADVLGSAAAIKNYRLIALFRRPGQDAGFLQAGSGEMPLKVEAMPGGTGVGPTGEVGIRITLGGYDITPLYDYTGELPAPAGP